MENTFGKNLKYYRVMKGMTQKELAALCNISAYKISNYETGKTEPNNMETIKKLAEVLDIKVSNFFKTKIES